MPRPQVPWWRHQARALRRGWIARRRATAEGDARKRLNTELNQREFWHGRTELQSWPRQVQVGTNWTCNLKCSFCRLTMPWTQAQLKALPPRELQISPRVEQAIHDLLPYPEMMTLTPLGEPLMWSGLKEFLGYHASLGSRNLALTSNGMLLSEGHAERLVRGELSHIFLSIDSNDPEVYASMRVGGDLRTVEAGIERLNAWKQRLGVPWPIMTLNATFMRRNIDQLPSMVEWAHRLGFADVSVQLMEMENPELESEFLGHHLAVARARVGEALETARRVGQQITINLALRNLISAGVEGRNIERHGYEAASPIMPENAKGCSGCEGCATEAPAGETPGAAGAPAREPASNGNSITGGELDRQIDTRGKTLIEKCHYPWYNLLIDTDGDVRTCCWVGASWGNLNQKTLGEIWNGEPAQTMRGMFLANRIPLSCQKKHCRVDL